MNQLRHELGTARRLRVADGAVPIQHRIAIGVGIDLRVLVRPVALADDEVLAAVAIDVGPSNEANVVNGTYNGFAVNLAFWFLR